MIQMVKQLTRQIFRNRIFIVLLLILTVLTSLSFFFVKFSVDGNMAALEARPRLTENQTLYQNALRSNNSLAYTFFISLTGLTAFVFVMFFYRFFRSNRKQIGCLKALGFRDSRIGGCFVLFTAALSASGALLGMLGGYFLSGILIQANMLTYRVTGLVQSVTPVSAVTGLAAATLAFCLTAFLCYGFVRGREAGVLIAGNENRQSDSAALRVANAISSVIPVKNKFPLRLALRKPAALLLVAAAVLSFTVFILLGRSLNISSQKVMDSQTVGHNYHYDIRYSTMQNSAAAGRGGIPYLELPGKIRFQNSEIEQNLLALYNEDAVFVLLDGNGQAIPPPDTGGVVIGPQLAEIYGVRAGDRLTVSPGSGQTELTVLAVAANAKTACLYINADQLAELAGLPARSFNGELRAELPAGDLPAGTQIRTKAERMDELERNAVSNNVSAVINQATGLLVGCILIFLALYLNFQDNTRDMLILHLMGYRSRAIRKMLVNVYQPVVWAAFFITLFPGIRLAQSIQRSLSISTNDYMPFGTDIFVVLLAFAMLNILYLLVQAVFAFGIKRILAKEKFSEYTASE